MVKKNKIDFFLNKTSSYLLPYTKYQIMENFFKSKLEEIKYIDVNNEETKQTIEEIKQTVDTIHLITTLSVCFSAEVDVNKKIELLTSLLDKENEYLDNQKKLWRNRNKEGGLKSSISYLEYFYAFVRVTLDYLKTGVKR